MSSLNSDSETTLQGDAEKTTKPAGPEARIARYDSYYDYRTFSYVTRKTNKPKKERENSRKNRAVLLVVRHMNPKGLVAHTTVEIKSEGLCNVLKELNEGVEGLELSRNPPLCDPSLFFFSSDALKDRLEKEQSITPPNQALISDLQVAVAFIYQQYSEVRVDVDSCIASRAITFNLLWAMFPPNTLAYHYHHLTEQHRIVTVTSFGIRKRDNNIGSIYAYVVCELIGHDGNAFGRTREDIEVADQYEGSRSIYDLGIYPLKYYEDPEGLRRHAIERGRRFVRMSVEKKSYNEISGPCMREVPAPDNKVQLRKLNSYGRIMVDPTAFRTFQPNCIFNLRVYQRLDANDLTDEQLMICTPIVLGFCFGTKVWGGFALDRVKEIEWSEEAFRSLVLGEKQKTLILSLVQQHASRSSQIDDIVKGKGKGLIGLFAGPPGCGKTLTAEAVAEITRRPLYVISAGELGTKPHQVDEKLLQILELARTWDAILLLDEADVFLAQRSTTDVSRNALVSIFLRQLEYYQGILFLTTNMVMQCDVAFESRIHFSLYYPNLDFSARREIWKTFVCKTGTLDIDNTHLDELAAEVLNGRQIKNTISSAQSIALQQNAPLSIEHINTVLSVAREWNKARRMMEAPTESLMEAPDAPEDLLVSF